MNNIDTASLPAYELPPRDHNNPPAPITPETLVNLETLPKLLADNYGPLAARGAQLADDMAAWIDAHRQLPPADWDASRPFPLRLSIADEADNLRSADFFNMIAAWAGGKTEGSGEVDEARKKVKFTPFQACKAIDGFFNGMRADLRASLLAGFQAQDRYINDKIIAERRERERVAALERQAADRALAEARRQRMADEATNDAVRAEAAAEAAQVAAAAPITNLARSTSMGGVTVSAKTTWTWEVTDKRALMKAIAEGRAPETFWAANDRQIDAWVKQEKDKTDIPGITVTPVYSATRNGARG
jgi:hypothetical protein